MIIIQDAVISFIEKLKDLKRIYKLSAFALAAIILIAVSVVSSGVRITYNVNIEGETLANVASVEVYKAGLEKAYATVKADDMEIVEAELEPVVTVNSTSATADEVSEIILENSPSVLNGYELCIDGTPVSYITDLAAVESAMDERLVAFNVDGATCENKFSNNVAINPAYFHVELLSNEEAINTVSSLDVVTVAVTTTEYSVKHDTVTQKDSSKQAGYTSVLTQGIDGLNKKIETVTYLNGVATDDSVVEQVMSRPVTEVVLVGTKNTYVTSAPQNAAASGFRWPLSVAGTVTSPYGYRAETGTFHHGIDIGVPIGTQVVAVKAGTVTQVTYTSDYGYYVTLDHGNGVQTRYAHNKANTVSVGDYVSAGQVIALSGNSGRSTGPHLHFEVIINGNRVNPANYVRL